MPGPFGDRNLHSCLKITGSTVGGWMKVQQYHFWTMNPEKASNQLQKSQFQDISGSFD
jgi:hypothetical protein